MTLPGHDPRLGPLLQPGAGARRAGDGRVRHLLARASSCTRCSPARGPGRATAPPAVALARLSGPVPDPRLARPSVPPDLAAITRKALAPLPIDRFASATAMADALETSRSATGGAGAGTAAAAAAAGVAAASAGVARSNPTVVSYPSDAYAGADDVPPPYPSTATGQRAVADDEESRTSPVVWIAGIAAILLLAAIGFIVFQMLSGPSTPPTQQVAVPDFVGKLLAEATQEAESVGLKLDVTDQTSEQPVGTILDQFPVADTMVDSGSTIRVTVASGVEQVPMPDLRNKTEALAVQEIVTAGLAPGREDRGLRPDRPGRARRVAEPCPGRRRRQGLAGRLRHLEGPGTDAVADTEPDAVPDTRTHAEPDAGTHPDADTGTDAYPASDRRTDADPDLT